MLIQISSDVWVNPEDVTLVAPIMNPPRVLVKYGNDKEMKTPAVKTGEEALAQAKLIVEAVNRTQR